MLNLVSYHKGRTYIESVREKCAEYLDLRNRRMEKIKWWGTS